MVGNGLEPSMSAGAQIQGMGRETPLPHEELPLALAQLQAQPLVLGAGEVWSCAGAAECLWQLAGD